jgi:putative transposase
MTAFGRGIIQCPYTKISSSTFADRSGNVWDNAAMESFFSSLKIERTSAKTYRTRDQAKADVIDYIECFYNPRRRHSTLGYLSPIDFEKQAALA